jgi:hypothetical protein
LRKCALRKIDDPWAVSGAIESLRLIASPRSREILVEAQAANENRRASISKAIEYIDTKPAPLIGTTVVQLAERVVQALALRGWKGNSAPRCNQSQDNALIDFYFETSEDVYVYTATFHKVGDTWNLRGVREAGQGLKAATNLETTNRRR